MNRSSSVLWSLALAALSYQGELHGQPDCAEKRRTCDSSCASAAETLHWPPGRVKQCEIDCYKREGCGSQGDGGQAPPARPWDAVAAQDGPDRLDPNGFLRNPTWQWGLQRTTADSLLDACDSCPCADAASDAAQSWMQTATCASSDQGLTVNSNDLCGKPWSDLNSTASGINYHMNWFPIMMEGDLAWDDHSPAIGGDDDYNFHFRRPPLPSGQPDLSLVTKGRDSVQVEFNASETVDNWDGTGTWWERFHHDTVDKFWNDNEARRTAFGTHSGFVIGLLGLDLAHKNHHSELHPAYAMFIDVTPGPRANEERWAFFVRNWGDEGYCGSGLVLLQTTTMAFRLAGALVASNVWVYSHDAGTLFATCSLDDCVKQTNISFGGGALNVELPSPTCKCGVVGDLTIRKDPATASSRVRAQPRFEFAPDQSARHGTAGGVLANMDEDAVLAARIAKLKPAARQQLEKRVTALYQPPRNVPRLRRLKVASINARPQAVPPLVTRGAIKIVPDPSRAARETKKRQLIDEFLKSHGVN